LSKHAQIFFGASLAKNVAVRLLKFRSIAIVSADLIRSHHSRGGLWPARNAREAAVKGQCAKSAQNPDRV